MPKVEKLESFLQLPRLEHSSTKTNDTSEPNSYS